MFNAWPIEDTVLLTFLLIDALLVLFCLLKLLNTSRSFLIAGRSLLRHLRRTSTLSCFLATLIFGTISFLYLRDIAVGVDDDPSPVELEADTLQQAIASAASTVFNVSRLADH